MNPQEIDLKLKSWLETKGPNTPVSVRSFEQTFAPGPYPRYGELVRALADAGYESTRIMIEGRRLRRWIWTERAEKQAADRTAVESKTALERAANAPHQLAGAKLKQAYEILTEVMAILTSVSPLGLKHTAVIDARAEVAKACDDYRKLAPDPNVYPVLVRSFVDVIFKRPPGPGQE